MAIFIPGGMVAEIRGSLGGAVASANRAGRYWRNRTIPINPSSPRQQAVRFAMASLMSRWVETLTAAQRASWETYAANVHLPNSLGQPRNVGGVGMYIRANVPRISGVAPLLDIVDDGPTIYDLGSFTAPAVGAVSAATQQVSWGHDIDDAWAIEIGAGMFVYGSKPQNPSVNFFDGPYNVLGTIPGAAVPPPSPQVLDLAFPVVVGQKVFFRCNVVRADGRTASSFRGEQIVSA